MVTLAGPRKGLGPSVVCCWAVDGKPMVTGLAEIIAGGGGMIPITRRGLLGEATAASTG